MAEDAPAVMVGASFAYVNTCDRLPAEGRRRQLPEGSRLYDGGGFKGRSRVVRVEELRETARRVFGVPARWTPNWATCAAPSLPAALERELGDPEVLDGFRGGTRALGPRVVPAVFSGNVPGLPARSLVRALPVKAAVIAKIPAREPHFTAAFVRTLHDVEPAPADAVVATYRDRADDATLSATLAQAGGMRRAAPDCPPGRVGCDEATVLQHRRIVAEWRAASSPTGEVSAPNGLEWTVVLDDSLLPLSGAGNGVARIVTVPDLGTAVEPMRP